MDVKQVKDYCDNLWVQLTVWKEELNDVVKIAENFPDREKEQISSQLSTLTAVIEDITRKIDQFKMECPSKGDEEDLAA